MKLDIEDIKKRAGLLTEADSKWSRKAWEEKYNKQQATKDAAKLKADGLTDEELKRIEGKNCEGGHDDKWITEDDVKALIAEIKRLKS